MFDFDQRCDVRVILDPTSGEVVSSAESGGDD